MDSAWRAYQEEAAEFFRSLGLGASTDVRLKGARTSHDIDVLVRFTQLGIGVTWIVECKNWKASVSKLHVLALREIVTEVGADRGILLSESGFQSGANDAAKLSNVLLTSLAGMRIVARNEIYSARSHELYNRIENCNDRYWKISKRDRIDHGLRPEVMEVSYSGTHIIEVCRDVLSRTFRGIYPFSSETVGVFTLSNFPAEFTSPEQVVLTLEPLVMELENKLSLCEASLEKT